MFRTKAIVLNIILIALCSGTVLASTGPEAAKRTYAQNYKDMVLAACIATAYANEKGAAVDAGSSVTALREWTYYDMEKSPDAIRSLVDRYLARDYYNPLAESEVRSIKFDLLKCFDLYHSDELAAQTRQMVLDPTLYTILCKCLFSEVTVQAVTELDDKTAHCHAPVPQRHRPFL
ncbi:type VI secretion system amidase immunity protein Tai4 [Pluralibacter gergoviae]|uniref:type VI secretion system amidase immunity protein Tai4 n=1 Tax=Pluralibacter gergoviae TaxID=61647 RepID=UPI00193A87F4|nr:type VI secretion system amidase immunity protein Tai4 [Pluralibacter gergoviae]